MLVFLLPVVLCNGAFKKSIFVPVVPCWSSCIGIVAKLIPLYVDGWLCHVNLTAYHKIASKCDN